MSGDARESQHDDLSIRLHAEELSVERRQVETGRVRVATVVREHQQLVDELLTHHRVEVVRVPRGEAVFVVPAVREEGDTLIVPVIEEVLVVERRLVLKEEIRIRRVATTERRQGPVTLRSEDIVVTRNTSTPPQGERRQPAGVADGFPLSGD